MQNWRVRIGELSKKFQGGLYGELVRPKTEEIGKVVIFFKGAKWGTQGYSITK